MDRKVVDSWFSGTLGTEEGIHRVKEKSCPNVTISGLEHIPNKGSFIVVSNHPATIDPILAASIPNPRKDTTIVMRLQSSKNFPEIRRFQLELRKNTNLFFFSHEVRRILEALKEDHGILLAGNGTLDNTGHALLPQVKKICLRAKRVIMGRIQLSGMRIENISYGQGSIELKPLENLALLDDAFTKLYE